MDNPKEARRRRIEAAARVSDAFRQAGFDPIQYGGATVEFYTQGEYTTGDVDIGFLGIPPGIEEKQRIMESLGSSRSWRLFQLDGIWIDLGHVAEMFSRRFIEIETGVGRLKLEAPEECLVGRFFMGNYPQTYDDQIQAARLLVLQALAGGLELDWDEVWRIAALPAFDIEEKLRNFIEDCRREWERAQTQPE